MFLANMFAAFRCITLILLRVKGFFAFSSCQSVSLLSLPPSTLPSILNLVVITTTTTTTTTFQSLVI